MKETRKLYWDDLRRLCIEKNWYTYGCDEEYSKMLDIAKECKNITTETIVNIAEDILRHSDTEQPLTSICFDIAGICNSFFDDSLKDEFSVEILAKGSFQDRKFSDEDCYTAQTFVLRLNYVALNEYHATQVWNERDCYEDGEKGELEWKEYQAEHALSNYAWREKIIKAIGVEFKPEQKESLTITQAQSEIFTVVYMF